MSEEKPISIKGLTAFLETTNLKKYQKHEHFHVIRFADHKEEMPQNVFVRSENYFEVTLSDSNEVDITVDGKRLGCEGSSIFFLSPGQTLHIDVHKKKKAGRGYMLLFTIDFLNFVTTEFNAIQQFPYFNMHLSSLYSLKQEDSNILFQYIEQIYHEFQKFDEDNVEIIRSLLTLLLFEAKRLLKAKTLKNVVNSRAEEITFQFENLLKKTECKKQTLGYYASQLNISTIYLSECVKKTTGKSAKKIVTEYLLFEAKSLLFESTQTVDAIAFQMGFGDTPNFIKFFKKNTQKTPHQFRKMLHAIAR